MANIFLLIGYVLKSKKVTRIPINRDCIGLVNACGFKKMIDKFSIDMISSISYISAADRQEGSEKSYFNSCLSSQ
jgi:hypothetical protein